MNRFCHTTILIWIMITAGIFRIYATAGNASLPDSLITDDYVYEYTFSDFDKAVRIMQELRKQKKLSQFRLDVVEGDLYFNTGKYLQALKFYKRVLESDSVLNNDTEYMEQVHRMISCYDCLHDEVKKSGYVRLLLQKAEKCGNKEMQSIALFNMGKMIYYQEDKQRGYQMIKDAISLMEQTDYIYKYDNLRYNYNTLLIMQQRDKQYEDALQTLDELEKVVVEATNQEPEIEGLVKKELKTMYAQRAVILSRLGKSKEADETYHLWEEIGNAYSKDDYLIVPYLMDRKLYDKVIAMYIPRETFLHEQKDTVNYHMMSVKRALGKAYEGKKDYKRAARYFEEMAILTDSLKAREQRSSAIELATIYETHEQKAKLEEQNKRIERRNVMLISAAGTIFFLLLLFVRNIQYTRTIRQKNRVMVKTIQESLNYKEKYYELKEQMLQLLESTPLNVQNAIAATEHNEAVKHTPTDTDTENNETLNEAEESRLLFETLDNIVTQNKLFLNPNLSREELMKLIHVNKNQYGKLLKQNVNMTTTGYINNKRLEYAIKLLMDTRNFTITAIADECGIPNVPTFNRLFRNKFGMTPSEYRNGMKAPDYMEDMDCDGQSDRSL